MSKRSRQLPVKDQTNAKRGGGERKRERERERVRERERERERELTHSPVCFNRISSLCLGIS